MTCDHTLANVLVPASLLASPGRFGGRRQKDCLQGDLIIRDGKVAGMTASPAQADPPRLVMPKLTECHVHLDKCHSVSRMDHSGGDLRAAIAAQAADRATWTAADIHDRASRGLGELISSGCGRVRSHVDWTHGEQAFDTPPAWQVLSDLAQDFRDEVTLQVAPLIGIADLADPDFARFIARLVARNSGVLGAFVLDQPERGKGIMNAFQVAGAYGLALDFHVDEGLADGLDGLEMIADAALATGFRGPVLCGHACSLANLEGQALARMVDKIAGAGLTVAALPTTNLYLQGRNGGTPDRRGITRLNELRAAGVSVVVGTDNVRDAFCPIGRHDPRHALALAVLAAHLDPPLGDHLPMITTRAEIALGLDPTCVDGAAIGDLLLFDAASTSELLSGAGRQAALSDIIEAEIT